MENGQTFAELARKLVVMTYPTQAPQPPAAYTPNVQKVSGTGIASRGLDICTMFERRAYTDERMKPVVEAAIQVKGQAYCPYSQFKVGCGILCHDGKIFTGCNVENASYGLSICAERVAIVKAVSEGYTSFKALAVCCDVKNSFKGSCGACRQFFVEFGLDWDIYLVKPDKSWKRVPVRELLPLPFCPEALNEERTKGP